MFNKALAWSGYKKWGTRGVGKELLWSYSTREEVISQFNAEWGVLYEEQTFPGTLNYLDTAEKINSLRTVDDCNSAYSNVDMVNYKINSLGFRGDWELDNTDPVLNIGFFGCSFTYGVGIAENDSFTTLITNELSRKLGVQCKAYNCGVPGGSASKITRYYSILSKFIHFDYVIIVMPHAGRMEYPMVKDKTAYGWNIIPNWEDDDHEREQLRLSVYKAIDDNFLYSDFIRNINHCEAIAKSNNSKVYFSSWDQISYEYIYNYYINSDPTKLLPWFQSVEYHISPRILLARDGIHPGPRSHSEFAKRATEYIV